MENRGDVIALRTLQACRDIITLAYMSLDTSLDAQKDFVTSTYGTTVAVANEIAEMNKKKI